MNIGRTEKPAWVRKTEEHIGLDCVLYEERGEYTEWWVTSDTGVRLFRIGGYSDMGLGSITMPDMKTIAAA